MLGELGDLPDIVETTLNHVSIRSPLAASYNRSRHRPQVAAAMQRLAEAPDRLRQALVWWQGYTARPSEQGGILV
jgi:hypothetical protein